MHKFLARLLVNAAALVVAAQLLSGIQFGSWRDLLLTAIVFGLVNAFIRPVVRLATYLISVITLGLFTLIVNALMLLLTAVIAEGVGIDFRIASFWDAFLGALIISLASFILTKIIR